MYNIVKLGYGQGLMEEKREELLVNPISDSPAKAEES